MKKNEVVSKVQFEQQHKRIVQCAADLGKALYDFSYALKEMHESKAYLAAGYTTFEDYTVRL